MNYSITVREAGRESGEYPGGDTIEAARREASEFAALIPSAKINICKPVDWHGTTLLEIVEEIQ